MIPAGGRQVNGNQLPVGTVRQGNVLSGVFSRLGHQLTDSGLNSHLREIQKVSSGWASQQVLLEQVLIVWLRRDVHVTRRLGRLRRS